MARHQGLSSEQEDIAREGLLDNILLTKVTTEEPEEALDEVCHGDCQHWVLSDDVDQTDVAYHEDDHVVVEVAVEVAFKHWVLLLHILH